MIKEAYLVIEQGYEGIQGLLYLTLNAEEARDKVMELKNSIIKAKEHKAKVLEEFGSEQDENYYTEWDRMCIVHETIQFEEYDKAEYKNPDDYCVVKWDGTEFSGCRCTEVGCPPSETKIY